MPVWFILLFSLLPTNQSPAASQGIPKVDFRYSFVPFDRSCSELTETKIEQAWIEELESRMDEFRSTWDNGGPALLKAVIEEIGSPFVQSEMIATMTLSNFRSMSLPLILNVRRHLSSFTDGNPRPMPMFVGLVFHELLHTYVVDHLDKSKLWEKYKDEPGSVLSHLHLNALMKMAYLKLGREEELASIVAKDTSIGPIYKRAWEIVNDLEGHEAFVAELKQQQALAAGGTAK